MARRHHLMDAQQALGFMVNQASIIEAAVYRTVYPDIQYPALVPVDETAPEWAKSITFFSIGQVGKADWFHHLATDMRLADITRDKFEQGIEMAGIGYRYTLEEISQAQQLGINLGTERGLAASRAYEEFVEAVVIAGDTVKNWTGLINDAGVSAALVANPGSGTTWAVKTSDQIIADVNAVLTGIYTASNTIEMADTLLLPVSQMTLLATKRLSDAVQSSVLDWIQRYNVYHCNDWSAAHYSGGSSVDWSRCRTHRSDGRVSPRSAGRADPHSNAPSLPADMADRPDRL
jgi:hypothetical protein